jgi:succinate dehydrogenase / fumarate reductase flavoprotein subunit
MGGLWVDYQLMSSIPGLFVLGEANFSEHGANRLGASALMQGLADGYFIAPASVTGWLASTAQPALTPDHPACREALAAVAARIAALRAIGGGTPVDAFHRQLGALMIEACGISRSGAGLERALVDLAALTAAFRCGLALPDPGTPIDPELEKALRLEDFLELAALMLRDALAREESCGAHFREEHQTAAGEARRDDAHFAHIAAWEHAGGDEPRRHTEPLTYTAISPSERSYR